jgi:hypothetical protein
MIALWPLLGVILLSGCAVSEHKPTVNSVTVLPEPLSSRIVDDQRELIGLQLRALAPARRLPQGSFVYFIEQKMLVQQSQEPQERNLIDICRDNRDCDGVVKTSAGRNADNPDAHFFIFYSIDTARGKNCHWVEEYDETHLNPEKIKSIIIDKSLFYFNKCH